MGFWAVFLLRRGQDDLIRFMHFSNCCKEERLQQDHNIQINMDSNFKGTLWPMFIFFTLPRLTCQMNCPLSCFCPKDIACQGNDIKEIPTEIPRNTTKLVLFNTAVNVLEEHSFRFLTKLTRLQMVKSPLNTIHPKAFSSLSEIRSIVLIHSNLSNVPANVFSSLTELQQLSLDGNQLESISPELFKGLIGLQDLTLSQNKLRGLTSDVFDDLGNLTLLNLCRNSIQKLPSTIFHGLTKLERLDLNHNQLEELHPGIFDSLVALKELRIQTNRLRSLPPQVFWLLRNLRILFLSYNRLQTVPKETFYYMPLLSSFTLYRNPLIFLPDQLMGHMPNLREFHLYGTNLTTVPGNLFANMSGLLGLYFGSNDQLKYLPSDLFCCLPNLLNLTLESNNLHHLHSKLFSRLTSLQILRLHQNKLQNLPGDIFQGLGKLSIIDLKENQLKTLSGDILWSNKVLSEVHLSNNTWNCNCSIRGFVTWIRKNEHVVPDTENTLCLSPMYKVNRTLNSLQDKEFDFCDATTASYFTPSLQAQTTTTLPHIDEFYPTTDTLATDGRSPPFYDKVVVENGPDFVHNNLHSGWVYLWFLPSDTSQTGLLMFSHFLLVATGVFLILATMYGMCRLDRIIDKLTAESAKMFG